MEYVDILVPPAFNKSGEVKPREQAIKDGNWIATCNIWVIQTDPVPALVYQVRSSNSSLAPSKLDVSAGGHYQAGENLLSGLREAEEELGKVYTKDQVEYIGRKMFVGEDIHGYMRHNIVEIFFVKDNTPLSRFTLQKDEVHALVACPLASLIKLHVDGISFTVPAISNEGETYDIAVTTASFPYNWDNYHFKIALLAERYLKGEQYILY